MNRSLSRAIGIALSLSVSVIAPVLAQQSAPDEDAPKAEQAGSAESNFRSSEDGWLDVSGFLDKPYGFLPLLVPITEPAVGYGAAGGLAFIQRKQGESQSGFGRPDITAVGGLATQNDTWGLFAGDLRHWYGDRFESFVGLVKASVNLDFYGIGEETDLRDHPLAYNLEPVGGVLRGKYRIGNSRVWAGLSYMLAETGVNFDAPDTAPGLPDSKNITRVGGVTPLLSFDSRDNFFTPNRGTFFEGTAGLYSEALGGDSNFQRIGLLYVHYWPLDPRVTLGLRGRMAFSFGDAPFYMRPFIWLRGVAMMRYQGGEVADLEAEVRWQFWKRLSLVGFAGSGVAWNNFENLDNSVGVVTGGTGFRYEIARRYGLHVGMDVAFGPDNPVLYIVFGSAWARP